MYLCKKCLSAVNLECKGKRRNLKPDQKLWIDSTIEQPIKRQNSPFKRETDLTSKQAYLGLSST